MVIASRRRLLTVLASVGAVVVTAMAPPSSCAVVGVGVLGTHLCRQLLQESSSSSSSTDTVVGITATTKNHGTIRAALDASDQLQLLTADDDVEENKKCTNVVFCAPPSGFEDYPAAVKAAAEKYWLGPEGGGTFVFTSSGAVYGPGEGADVTEDSPVADDIHSPRVHRLLAAEQAALDAGGCVVRLAGLYELERGAHNYWLLTVNKRQQPIPSSPAGIVNQVHYEDAAGACFAALQAVPSKTKRRVFLISDGNPQTRLEICQSALQAAVYKDAQLPQFDSAAKGGGKVYRGAASNAALQWKPRYPSFDAFMKSMA